jgi:hypothetical protein
VRLEGLFLIFAIGVCMASMAQAEPNVPDRDGTELTGDSVKDIVPPHALETNISTATDVSELVEVVLELVIDANGHVTSARGIEGTEPFRSEAESAALQFLFTPARRRGVAVPSKVRFLVKFEPSASTQAEPVPGRPKPKSAARTLRPAPARMAKGELEVTVTGARTAQISTRITRVEAREIPGTFGDPLRAVETNPGVTPLYTGVPFFFVRGAPPGNVGYYVDGIRVPLLYHALLGPSVIHPGLIDHVDIFRGAAPARYGGTAGATIAAESREPLQQAGGEANLRVFDVGGIAEKPLDNGRLHVLAGGRYSYTALIASLLSGAKLQYWDYQTRVGYDLGRKNRITVTAFGAFDRFESGNSSSLSSPQSGSSTNNASNNGNDLYGGGLQFHRIDIREDYTGTRTRARLAATFGYDRTETLQGYLRDPMIATRSVVEHRLSPELLIALGHDTSVADYSLRVPTTVAGFDVLRALFPTRRDMSAGAHLEATWSPTPFVTLAPGMRADTFRSGTQSASSADARFSAVIAGSRHFRAIETVGTSHQPPGFVPQIPGAQLGGLASGLQRSLQVSSGFAFDVANEFTAVVTGFEAQYTNLIDPISEDRTFDLTTLDPQSILSNPTRGTATGLEIEVHRPLTHRLGGYLAYTLSRNTRIIDGHSTLSGYDRPHVFQAALGYDFGRHWRAGTRLVAYSGFPARQQLQADSDIYLYDGAKRAPAFYRIDVRLEKRWPFSAKGYWAVVFEMLNATLSKEVIYYTCSTLQCTMKASGPVSIPSIGLELYSY